MRGLGRSKRDAGQGAVRRLVLAVLVAGMVAPALWAQSNEDCLTCHGDQDLTGTRNGQEISVFVDEAKFARSVHGELECIACHSDLEGADFPHPEVLQPVRCAACHEDIADELARGPHGKWATPAEQPSASCTRCHGVHDVLPPKDPAAPTNPANAEKLCGQCHQRQVREVERSAHGSKGRSVPRASCVDCHRGHDVTKPKDERTELAICVSCHPKQVAEQKQSVHARAALKGDPLAPSCVTCHSHHEILPKSEPASPTATMNVPLLCGQCHHEGSKVSLERNIPQDRILENYSLSIHGEGLFKKGLTVTAVCTSCHNSHLILDHNDPRSSINPENIATTCTRCHSQIERVHVKVIEGRLWEEAPHKIPACIDCHRPHKIRRTPVNPSRVANKECMRCHGDPNLTVERDGQKVSLYIDEDRYNASTHANTACAQCHTEVNSTFKRPCAAIKNPVDCSVCHAEVVADYDGSVHGQLAAQGDPEAPTCRTCHDPHATQSHNSPTSPTFPRNVPALCGSCHAEGLPVAERVEKQLGAHLGEMQKRCETCHRSFGAAKPVKASVADIVGSFKRSVHGKGLLKAGLVVAADCTDCHTSHDIRKPTDPLSSVNRRNLVETCGRCHEGIAEQFKKSIHYPGNGAKNPSKLPVCEDCHTSHSICRTTVRGFRTMMISNCGRCHQDEAKTFFDTFHGKVSRLGEERAAKCYDCHGTHNILPPEDPRSTLSHDNVVTTCAKCHPGAHRQFAGYLTHATHHDPKKYPYLYYAFVFMTTLLVGTLAFFILHTLLWLMRLWRTKDTWKHHRSLEKERFYVRFNTTQRLMHGVMILSFFTLAITGMCLKFSYAGWAVVIARILGGFQVTGTLHRLAAVTLLALFLFHVRQILKAKAASGKSWIRFVFSEDSLMFNLNDIKEFWQHVKWFFGRGERPRFGRWTYWEKFDYFAVFWGVFVIGSTGLMLWFPTFFTRVLPGWMINVATIIHSDEALLAVAFIFTIHFFNTHFRPDKFPMDPVIFTGRVPLEELEHDKPGEYEELMASENPEEKLAGPMPRARLVWLKAFGFTALTIGLTLIFLIVYAMLFSYR